MAYLPIGKDVLKFNTDISSRKEFRMYNKNISFPTSGLNFHSYQQFIQNYINPYDRICLMWSTGIGKTIGALGIAHQYHTITKGNVFIIGFTKDIFQRELLRFTEFGFISKKELEDLKKLRLNILQYNSFHDRQAYKELMAKYKKRLTAGENGYFKFYGYKELANRIFNDSENLKDINYNYVKLFENSLIICDEIHNVYNTLEPNIWGNALQEIFDRIKCKVVLLSATILNNSPSEFVDFINLLHDKKITKDYIFNKDNSLKRGARKKIHELSIGKFSFITDNNPALFPDKIYKGKIYKEIGNLPFIKIKFNKTQQILYNKVESYNDIRNINDFVVPYGHGVYNMEDIKKLIANKKIDFKWNGVPYGDQLNISSLHKYSPKYAQMINNVDNILLNKGGKIFIYHNFVHNTGILLIEQIMRYNGFISFGEEVIASTKCICGVSFKDHNKNHDFKPARYMMVHSDISKSTIYENLGVFNSKENASGELCMILIGSRIIKESFDLKAVRNILVTSRPDNISTLIQIIGRGVRKNSHIWLPKDEQNVSIYIYLMSQSNGMISYNGTMWKRKLYDFQLIQKIEKYIHESAFDSVASNILIFPGGRFNIKMKEDPLGVLEYKPINNTKVPIKYSTYEAFYGIKEIDLLKNIIRVSLKSPMTYGQLFDKIKESNFYFNTSMTNEEAFRIALSRLPLISKGEYIMFKTETKVNKNIININKYFSSSNLNTYDLLLEEFNNKYSIEEIEPNMINKYPDFHNKFIKELIITPKNTPFYKKMQEYYNSLSLLIYKDNKLIGHRFKYPEIYKDIWIPYSQDVKHYKENDIIIGFEQLINNKVIFKIRDPIQKIKIYKDTRKIMKGSSCSSFSKEYIEELITKLNIESNGANISSLCDLIRNELIERENNSKDVKWFYYYYEIKPKI